MPLSTLKNRLLNKLGVHPDVLKLGLVSFLTDLSSEMIFSVFAIFFTTVAGASAALLGLVEGLADLSASSLNYYAGWLSPATAPRSTSPPKTRTARPTWPNRRWPGWLNRAV